MIGDTFGKLNWADYQKDLKISWIKDKPYKYHNKMVYCYVRLSGLKENLVKGYKLLIHHKPDISTAKITYNEDFPIDKWILNCDVQKGYPEPDYYWLNQRGNIVGTNKTFEYKIKKDRFGKRIGDEKTKFYCSIRQNGRELKRVGSKYLVVARQSSSSEISTEIMMQSEEFVVVRCCSSVKLPSSRSMHLGYTNSTLLENRYGMGGNKHLIKTWKI